MNECGDCDLCCSVLPIEDLDFQKPAWTPCVNSACPGCRIYKKRPIVCRAYECGWKIFGLSPLWKPNVCGMVVNLGVFPVESLGIWVTEESGSLWRQEPFWSNICEMAGAYFFEFQQLTLIYPHGFRKNESKFYAVHPAEKYFIEAEPGDMIALVDGQLRTMRPELAEDWLRDTKPFMGQHDILKKVAHLGWKIDGRRLTR